MEIYFGEWAKMIDQVLSSYQKHLGDKYGDPALKRFNRLYASNEEAAISEAVVFNWLYRDRRSPEIKEDQTTGGVDFICKPDSYNQFVVEVTCLGRQAFTNATGCHMHPGQPMSLGSPTRILWQRVNDKARQLSGYEMPRVLAITSLHDGAFLFLNPEEATNFLISDCALTLPIGGSSDNTYYSTDLQKAIFFKIDDNDPLKLVPRRRSVSAVLLIPILGDKVNVTGILHPEPVHPFDIALLPKIPFLRVQHWPIQNGEIFTEWVTFDPYAASFPLYPILS